MAQTQILMTLSEIEFVSRTRNAVTRCVLRAYNAAKCECGQGSAPDPAGELTALPRPPSWFWEGREGSGREGREREREEKGREGGEGEGRGVDSDAQLEQGRRLAKDRYDKMFLLICCSCSI